MFIIQHSNFLSANTVLEKGLGEQDIWNMGPDEMVHICKCYGM